MTTSDKSQQIDLFPTESQSMSSLADSHAKTSAPPVNRQGSKVNVVGYGPSAPVLLGSFAPGTRSLKTSQTCLMENGELGFSEFSGTFPRSGMMRSGTVYQLPSLARTITEIGCGFWPTPLAQEGKHGAPTEWEMTTDHAATRESLRVQVNKRTFYWRTPDSSNGGSPKAFLEGKRYRESGHAIQIRLSDQVKMWPTPAASRCRGAPLNRYYGSPTYKRNLDEAVRTSEACGQLNPTWVEWLMGFPKDHTDLKR